MGDALPYRVRRRIEHGVTRWDVVDITTGQAVGTCFKYLGSWWANNAGSLSNRHGTKAHAAAAVWDDRTKGTDHG